MAHTPNVAVAPFWHIPVQHSASVLHASPVCVQYDGSEHRPPQQYFAQQSSGVAHWFPTVLQPGFKGGQTFVTASHAIPLQQPSAAVHG
jgi:hypothetical protein